MKPKNVLVISHERSGMHLLINTIRINFPYYSNFEIPLKSTNSFYIHRLLRKNPPIRNIFKSHHSPDFFKYRKEFFENYKIFYVVRNGLDVITSCYYHYNIYSNQGTISEFLRDPKIPSHIKRNYGAIENVNMAEKWAIHVNAALRNQNYFKIIRFEDIINDTDNTVNEIAKVLEMDAPLSALKPSLFTERAQNPRKGIVGDWRNHFNEEDAEYFYIYAKDIMKEFKYL